MAQELVVAYDAERSSYDSDDSNREDANGNEYPDEQSSSDEEQ